MGKPKSAKRVANGKYIASVLPRGPDGRFMRMIGPRKPRYTPKAMRRVYGPVRPPTKKTVAKKLVAAKKAVAAVKKLFKAKRKTPKMFRPGYKKAKVESGMGMYGYGMYL